MPHTILGSHAGPWFEVTTPAQAALLSAASAVRHLEPFMGRTLGVAEAAQELGVSTERMLYRVKQFVHVGLLMPAGVRPRRGRPIKLYRGPGAIQIPFHLTPFEDLTAQLSAQGRSFETLRVRAAARALQATQNQGRLLYRCDETGAVHSEAELGHPAARARRIGGDFVGTLWISEEVARQIDLQLDALLATVNAYSQPQAGTRPYLLMGVLLGLDSVEDSQWLRAPG